MHYGCKPLENIVRAFWNFVPAICYISLVYITKYIQGSIVYFILVQGLKFLETAVSYGYINLIKFYMTLLPQ